MDPNANLNEFRELRDAIAVTHHNGQEISREDLWRVFELYEAMDTWLTKGGFLPKAWGLAAGERHWQSVLESTNKRAAERMKAACRQAILLVPQEERSGGWVSISRNHAIAAITDLEVKY